MSSAPGAASDEPPIAIGVSPRSWADALHRFVADHGGARVRARVLDGRQALDEAYSVLVVDDLASFLTVRLVHELHRRGRRVLGVFDPVEAHGRVRLAELAVDEVVPASSPPDELLATVVRLASTAPAGATVPFSGVPPAQADGRRGVVTAVAGPPGGCGVTEVAVAVAAASPGRGRTVLVDADGEQPSVAQRLGLPLHPNLRSAVEAVEHWSGALADSLQRPADASFDVLVGAAAEGDGPRAGEVADVIAELAGLPRHVVVDLGHDLRGDRGAAAVARSLLRRCDRALVVAAPTPVGVTRLLRWLADARPTVPVHVVFNRVPPSRYVCAQLEAELCRTYQPRTVSFLPADRRVERMAWAGRPVRGGPFARAAGRLAVRAPARALLRRRAARAR